MSDKRLIVTNDGSHTLYIPELNETYHSMHGAIRESRHVFIEMGLFYFLERERAKEASILEIGFGTGLNALLCALFAKSNNVSVRYESLEAFPLLAEEVSNLNYAEQMEVENASLLFRQIHAAPWDERVQGIPQFELYKRKLKLQDYAAKVEFDICFFDAFAPSKQPEMWEVPMLEKVKKALKTHGIFVTYCAKGQLKRDLKSIGFEVETLPGPPGKLQMVRAIKI